MNPRSHARVLPLGIFAALALVTVGRADVLFTDTGGNTGDVDLTYAVGDMVVEADGSGQGSGNGNTSSLPIADVGGGSVGSHAAQVFYGRFLWAPGAPNDYINFSTIVGGGRVSFHSDVNGTRVRLFDTGGAPVPNIDIAPSPTGTTLVVFRVEMSGPDRAGDETVKIWYNPASFADVAAGLNPTGSGSVDMFDATNRGFGIHNPQISGSAGKTQYDNIVFGDTAADVLPGIDLTPFEITEIDYDPIADTFRITWRSTPGASYALSYSLDLAAFDSDITDSIASQGDLTTYPPLGEPPFANPTATPGPPAPRLFFRVGKNPGG
jgi:hypothetical protein